MKAFVIVGLGLIVMGAVAMTGCRRGKVVVVRDEYPPPHREVVVERHEPDVVVVDDRPDVVIVREAPPPLRVEHYGRPPAAGMIWISGYWSHHGRSYVWVGGRWDRPPHSGARWEPHRWEHDRDGYRFRPGGWKGEAPRDPGRGPKR